MESLAKSDIFFFITSISVIVITIVIVIAGYYVIHTLRNVRDISKTLKKTVHTAESEIEQIADRVTESPLFGFVFGKKKKRKDAKSDRT
jgi:hypothetical protein